MPRTLFGRLKSLGSLRDGLLVLASLIYGLGFCVWSVVAWRQNLGPLPVLDAQYFTAGLPPFLALCAVGSLVYLSRLFLLERWPRWLASRSLAIQGVIYVALASVGLASTILIFLILDERLVLPSSFRGQAVALMVISSALLVTNLLLQPKPLYDRWLDFLIKRGAIPEDVGQRLQEHWGWKFLFPWRGLSNLYLLLAGLGAAGIFYWSSILYMQIPQEFGGARPRCAYLDVVRSELSDEIRTILGMVPLPNPGEAVAESGPLDVFFVGKESVLVSPQGSDGPTIEIARTAVRALRWCSREESRRD